MTVRRYPYRKVHAFTRGDSAGNPAAYLDTGTQILSPAEMLAVAREHRGFVSEVVFVSRDGGGFLLSYWSSECEVDFCGHGTVAAMYDLISRASPGTLPEVISVRTARKGEVSVYNRIGEDDGVYVSAPEPRRFSHSASASGIAAALGAAPGLLHGTLPVDAVDAGLRTLIVPLVSLDAVVDLRPDQETLRLFCEAQGFDIVLAFSEETEHPGFNAHSRVFAPKFGYLEDPATGSGNSALGSYLLDRGLWPGERLQVEQGPRGSSYNEIRLALEGGKILFGGRASLRIEGSYLLT